MDWLARRWVQFGVIMAGMAGIAVIDPLWLRVTGLVIVSAIYVHWEVARWRRRGE